jgi:hypothetical protein
VTPRAPVMPIIRDIDDENFEIEINYPYSTYIQGSILMSFDNMIKKEEVRNYEALYSFLENDNAEFPYSIINTYSKIGIGMIYKYSLNNASFSKCNYIGDYTFGYCYSLTTANFPECSYIGNRAFWSCYNLTSISFPVCNYIDYFAFAYCSSLTSVNFPKCEYIGSSAFWFCSNLISANFPECSYIGNNAF